MIILYHHYIIIYHPVIEKTTKVMRDFKAWELKFSGGDEEDPDWTSREIINTLPRILTKSTCS